MVTAFLIFIVFALFVALILLTFFRNIILFVLGSLFGIFRKGKKSAEPATAGSDSSAKWTSTVTDDGVDGKSKRRYKKRISDSDGEYVDFEEVKK